MLYNAIIKKRTKVRFFFWCGGCFPFLGIRRGALRLAFASLLGWARERFKEGKGRIFYGITGCLSIAG
jgi:hypothetical protein